MNRPESLKTVLELLLEFRGEAPLKQLFWSELNYQRVNQSLPRKDWGDIANKALADDPVLFAAGAADKAFHVIYSRLASDRLLLGLERPVVGRLLRDYPYSLFVFSTRDLKRWHFVNVRYDAKNDQRRLFRRITVGPEERLRTAAERLALLDLADIGPAALDIQLRHDEAFDVETVTRKFFEDYKAVFGLIQD